MSLRLYIEARVVELERDWKRAAEAKAVAEQKVEMLAAALEHKPTAMGSALSPTATAALAVGRGAAGALSPRSPTGAGVGGMVPHSEAGGGGRPVTQMDEMRATVKLEETRTKMAEVERAGAMNREAMAAQMREVQEQLVQERDAAAKQITALTARNAALATELGNEKKRRWF